MAAVRVIAVLRKCLKTLASDMLTLVLSTQFKREVRRAKKQGKDLAKLQEVVEFLRRQELLPARYRDHLLRGDWKGYREVHIESGWLLIYRVKGNELHLIRTGSHSSIFS